jgi:hypothetical protein
MLQPQLNMKDRSIFPEQPGGWAQLLKDGEWVHVRAAHMRHYVVVKLGDQLEAISNGSRYYGTHTGA